MTNVEKLELELRQAKRQSKIADLTKRKESLEDRELGKVYATHTLSRNYKSVDATVMKVVGVVFGHYDCKYGSKELTDLTDDVLDRVELELKLIKIEYRKVDVEICKQTNFSISECYLLERWYEPYRYELTTEDFDKILVNVLSKIDTLGDGLRKDVPEWCMYINQGEHSRDKSMVDYLTEAGEKVSKLPNSDMVEQLASHPMLYGDVLVISTASKDIVKSMLKSTKEHSKVWADCPDIYNRDLERINVLTRVLDLKIWEVC